MPTQPTIYDAANLQQILQGGAPLTDFLKQRELERVLADKAGYEYKQAMDVQRLRNEGVLAASRGTLTARHEGRYPRKPGESDEDYMERVGKLQAQGPNNAYKKMFATLSTAEAKGKELEEELQRTMRGEAARRQPLVEAKARQDFDLDAAFKAAGSKTVPANVPRAIADLRGEKGGAAKAEALESAWQAALATADDPKKIPYSMEVGTKVEGLRKQIATVASHSETEAKLWLDQAKQMVNDPGFIGGPHLDFGMTGAASGSDSALKAALDAKTEAGMKLPPRDYAGIKDAPTSPVPVSPLLGPAVPAPQWAPTQTPQVPTIPGLGLVPANVNPIIGGVNRGLRAAGDVVDTFRAGAEIAGDAVSDLYKRGKDALFAGTPEQVNDQKVRQLFGNDAPALLAPGGPAEKLATSRGMRREEQAATFSKALAGDPQAVAGVKRVLDYLRTARVAPPDSVSPVSPLSYPSYEGMDEPLLTP